MTTLLDKATLEVAQFFGENDKPEDAARAVLSLVREEQMKAVPENRWAKSWVHFWWSSQAAQVRADE